MIADAYEKQRLAKSGIDDIDQMSGKTFEKYLEVLFEKLGYRVERTPYIGDYGADLESMLTKPIWYRRSRA